MCSATTPPTPAHASWLHCRLGDHEGLRTFPLLGSPVNYGGTASVKLETMSTFFFVGSFEDIQTMDVL